MTIVTEPIVMHMLTARSWKDIPTVLQYMTSDPYTVKVMFDDSHVWLLDRAWLRDGMNHPVGDADVRVWPAQLSGSVMYLQLRAPSGEALFEFSRGDLRRFLNRTDTVAPPGTEGQYLDPDADLKTLLQEG